MKKFAIAALLLSIGSAHAAGFDCNLASSEVENQICSDSVLSKLDEDLNTVYRQAVKIDESVKVNQRTWVREVRNVTPDLESAYRQRIADLKSRIKDGETKKPVDPVKAVQAREVRRGNVDADLKAMAESAIGLGMSKACVDEYLMTDEQFSYYKSTLVKELKSMYGDKYSSTAVKNGYNAGYNMGKQLKSLSYEELSSNCTSYQTEIQKMMSAASTTSEDFE